MNRESLEIVCVHYTFAFISNKLKVYGVYELLYFDHGNYRFLHRKCIFTEPKPSINENKEIRDIIPNQYW